MGRNAQIYVRDDAGPGAPTLLPKAVRLLRRSGGLAVIAHPGIIRALLAARETQYLKCAILIVD